MRLQNQLRLCVPLACILFAAHIPSNFGQANKYRGLWVGQVTLNAVNEVPIALDKNNNPVAPDPNKPTPTFDQAYLRIILHVNGAGQVSLLKDVAILNRNIGSTVPGSDVAQSDGDVALVTDELLYPQFPKQAAIRYASAVFDFGEDRATEALNYVLTQAVQTASQRINSGQDLTTAINDAKSAAQAIVDNANVKTAYEGFLQKLTPAEVDKIATTGQESLVVFNAAQDLKKAPFFDTRGIDAIAAIKAVAQSTVTSDEKKQIGENIAASFADIGNQYQRFIAGKVFGDAISGAADAAAGAAVAAGASNGSIRTAVNGNSQVVKARSDALTYRISPYADTRAKSAVDSVVEAIIASATSALPANSGGRENIRVAADQAARDALSSQVKRYPVSSSTPTDEYNNFVASAGFKGSAPVAAEAAAKAARNEKETNTLNTPETVESAAFDAAANALRDVFIAAAQAVRNELPIQGTFAPGSTGLTGMVFLPASHPTNPFMHRRHPDHTRGYDIRRIVTFDLDSSPGPMLPRAGFGVDRLTGVYREEVFGLHKPLGPNKDIGLKVSGTLELNRVSLIDTLNAL
jgi:hypothetical protein